MTQLILFGQAPHRVLKGDGFLACQEGHSQVQVGQPLTDGERFANAIADSNLADTPPDNPTYNITFFENTQEYADAVEEMRKEEVRNQIVSLERSALRSMIALQLDPSDNTERQYLQGYKDQIDALRATL